MDWIGESREMLERTSFIQLAKTWPCLIFTHISDNQLLLWYEPEPLDVWNVFSFKIWPFLLFCVSLNLGAASNQVKPTDGIPTLMADANDHPKVTQNKYKKTESDLKHKTTTVWHKTQCIRRPKNDTDLVIQLTRTSNYIVCLKYKTAQPKSDVVNV